MSDRGRLFALGALTLFLELTLIRWLSGSIWNLGYFPNLVLMAVFVGMGMGFLLHRRVTDARSPDLFVGGSVLLLALVAFVAAFHPRVPGFGDWGAQIGGELFFSATTHPTGASALTWIGFVACFLVVAAMFALFSQRTAKLFRALPPLTAYTLDIGGSIAGILAFMACSALRLPAWSWMAIAALPMVAAMPADRRWQRLLPAAPALLAAAAALAQDTRLSADYPSHLEESHWSPYQRIEAADVQGTHDCCVIFANGVIHQTIDPPPILKQLPYEVPYQLREADPSRPKIADVLVIGAGSGNDVAVALEHGVEHVDAVEIDPVIADIGRRHNPSKPYADPRVNLVIDDGRAFMTRTTRRYDLVVFALTDSLVRASGMNQLRLENFLFTRESVARAFTLLKPKGQVALYNFYRQPWLVEKLSRMGWEATGREPREIFREQDFRILAIDEDQPPAATAAETIAPPTDDWPFLYLQGHGVPLVYVIAMLAMGTAIALIMRLLDRIAARESADPKLKAAFLLMGVAFLLLETKSVVQFSLLFGNTWLNNSLVFLAVLVLVLAANWAALAIRSPRVLPAAFALLIVSCLVTLVVPLSALLAFGPLPRFVLASLLTFSPIFFANLIFSVVFRGAALPEVLFGWNLVGATLGGTVEYLSMAVGFSGLAWIVAGAYAVVFLLVLASRRTAG